MQDRQLDLAQAQPVAGAQHAHWDTPRLQFLHRPPHRRRRSLSKRRRAAHLAHRETLQQGDEAVEVIQVGVGQHQLVDPADAAVPQERRDVAARDLRAADAADVVEQRPAVRRFQHHAAAVADGEEGAAQLVPRRACGAADQADAQPHE